MDETPADGAANRQHLVTFRLGRQTYAVPIEPIVQIVEMVAIIPVPQLGAVIEGVINVHGEAVAVVDLRRHIGLAEASLHLDTPIMLVRVGGRVVGLIVDEVLDVLELPAERIGRPANILPEGLRSEPILSGVAYVAQGAVLLLDLDHLFRPDQWRVLVQAADLLQDALAGPPSSRGKDKPARRRRGEGKASRGAPAGEGAG